MKNSKIIKKTLHDIYELKFEYPVMNDIMKILKEEKIETYDQNFELSCSITLSFRKAETKKILSKFDRIKDLKIDFIETR